MSDIVCQRCGKSNPRMEKVPLPNDLGRKIHEKICQVCWREWMQTSVMVINEYGLNLLSPQGSAVYDDCLRQFMRITD